MINKQILALAVLSILCFSSHLSAANISIPYTDAADAYIDSSNPTTNYGASAYLSVYNNPSDYEMRTLIKFYLPGILTGKTITIAKLNLYKNFYGGGQTGDLVTAKRVTSVWDEMSVTWSTQPVFDSLYENTIPIDDQYMGLIVFEITDMVASWVDGTSVNYGVMLVHESSPNNIKNFFSSEASSPSLYIEYSDPVAIPEPLTMCLLGTGLIGLFLRRKK